MGSFLTQANESKFRSSEDTPLTVEPLKSLLGPTSEFLKTSKFSKQVRSDLLVPAEIRLSDFSKLWKCRNEKTQSSMSGLHFGFSKQSQKHRA